MASDADWPAAAEWTKAMGSDVQARSKTLAAGVYRPDFSLRAESYKDVQNAVKFAATNNVRLTLITTGHDFPGRNDAPTGLSLDTSLLKGINVIEEFVPTPAGAPKPKGGGNAIVPVAGKQPAVTFGVGVTSQLLHDAVSRSKLLTIGAAHGSVAPAGGFGQTAGHGPLSNRHGLAADQFLEFKVVTADGELKVANNVANPDLFWALRGGGGGTFGVVVEATVKAFPDIPITLSTWQINTTEPNSDGLWGAYANLHTHFVDLVEKKGVSGYYYIYPNSIKGVMLHQAEHAGKANAEMVWTPILDKMASFPTMTKAVSKIDEYPTYKAYFDARFGAVDKGRAMKAEPAPWETAGRKRSIIEARHGPGMEGRAPIPNAIVNLDSRLLGAEHFAHPNLTAVLKASAPFAIGGTSAVIQGHLVSAAVLPAWRKAYVHTIGYKQPGKASVDALRAIAPDMGAYANEAYPLEENWKTSFWGKNYERLSKIKTKYDPDMLFWVTPGVNADHMEVRDGRLCRLAKIVERKTPPLTDNLNNGRLIGGTINKVRRAVE
ncbi:Mitochondrial intermediate peptidase [Venturia nashicola]|nr:Mitochondrial intermediate peptidase [Venturia nashicola]